MRNIDDTCEVQINIYEGMQCK